MTANWRTSAACFGESPTLFDGSREGESPTERKSRQSFAVLICAECPVRDACAADVIEGRDEGVRGGVVLPDIAVRGRAPMTHGTAAGCQAHRRRKEQPCRPCMDAANRDKRERAARREVAA